MSADYDSVWFKCFCGAKLEAQSHAGPQCMNDYDCSTCPTSIAAEIKGMVIKCRACGARWRVCAALPDVTPVALVPTGEEVDPWR